MNIYLRGLSVLLLVSISAAHSPVLLWPAQKFPLPEGQSALEMMALDDFQRLFEHKKIIVFHKKTFNLEEVSSPLEPLSYLQTVDAIALQGVKSIHHLLGSLTSSDDLKIIHLEEKDLADQQDFIKRIMDENPGFAAILVGSGSHRTRRAAGDDSEPFCKTRKSPGNKTCMVYIQAAKENGSPLPADKCNVDCNEKGITITIGTYTLNVVEDRGGFSLSAAPPHKIDHENVWAPTEFSYSCSELNIISSDTKIQDKLTLSGVQIYPQSGDTFPESYDCSTWFTTTLWMGLLITLFYIFILFGAVLYLLDVKVNDRFDDPKGKTITVNVSE